MANAFAGRLGAGQEMFGDFRELLECLISVKCDDLIVAVTDDDLLEDSVQVFDYRLQYLNK